MLHQSHASYHRLAPLRVVGGPPRHSAYHFFLHHYARCIADCGAPVTSVPKPRPYALSLVKRALDGLRLPYLRPHPRVNGLLWAPQGLLLTTSPWIVDIEHATPFVGEHYDRFGVPFTRRMIASLLRRHNCRGIVCWSQACRRAFQKTCPFPGIDEKLHVVHPTLAFEPSAPFRMRTALRKLLFVFNKPEENFFLKSGLEVVQAFCSARRELPTLQLHVVGPVPGAHGRRLVETPGLVLHGLVAREKLAEIYSDCDLLVLPTVADTFGMTFLEAFSHGLPALAIRWYAVPEVVEHGRSGLLIEKPAPLVSWMNVDGIPIMNRPAFVQRRTEAPTEAVTATRLAEQIVHLARQPALLMRLSQGARERMTTGAFSRTACLAVLERLTSQILAG